jgi:signal transduction histidine kinase/CheY-like chemotaxis protein
VTIAENILRSLTSSSNEKFDGDLQIRDVITQLVADRLGAGICATLYCKAGGSAYRLLSIEDNAGLDTNSLPQIEAFVNGNKDAPEFMGRYIDLNQCENIDLGSCDAIAGAKRDLMYAFDFEAENGDSAIIVSFIKQTENTSVISADRVCKLAAQQLRVIFKFVEMEIHERALKSFMQVILRLSSLSFEGIQVSQTLERIGRLATELIGVGDAHALDREEQPDQFSRVLAELTPVAQFDFGANGNVRGSDTDGDITQFNADNSAFTLISGLTPDGEYFTTLETRADSRWALLFSPNPFCTFDEQQVELFRLFASYAAITLSNHNLAHRQKRINDDLRAAQDRLVEAESLAALGDMASGLAHDFNNLIGSVIGKIELLKNKFPIPELLAELEVIERLSEEGAERMRRLQEFALSAKTTNLTPVDLAEVYDSYMIEDRPWLENARNKPVTVSFVTPGMVRALISGKQADIGLMLDNLISNAIEATASGGEVTVALIVDDGRARITVSDTGTGVPDNIKHKIFNPFFTTKTSSQGAGLGLSVAHGIAVRHGGSISVGTSSGSIGSTFSAGFPIVDAPAQEVETPEQPVEISKMRVMVVDDDPQIRDVLTDMLTLIDHDSDSFEDAEAALAGYEKGKYDLVITDLGMPGMSGLELTVELKKTDPELPIAMVTGWGAQLNDEEILNQGIFKLVSKPFYLKDIREMLAQAPNRTV